MRPLFNILNLAGGRGIGVMLGNNVESWMEIHYWLDYYRYNYGVGVPYFNGQGTHQGVFVIVRQCEDTGWYYVVQ